MIPLCNHTRRHPQKVVLAGTASKRKKMFSLWHKLNQVIYGGSVTAAVCSKNENWKDVEKGLACLFKKATEQSLTNGQIYQLLRLRLGDFENTTRGLEKSNSAIWGSAISKNTSYWIDYMSPILPLHTCMVTWSVMITWMYKTNTVLCFISYLRIQLFNLENLRNITCFCWKLSIWFHDCF